MGILYDIITGNETTLESLGLTSIQEQSVESGNDTDDDQEESDSQIPQ